VDTIEELEKALSPRTALIYLMAYGATQPGQPMSTEAIAKIAKPKNIPVFVDAAAEVLTLPNVHLQQGANIVAYSGGKAICGPQCAGLLLGQKDILMSAWQASSPHHGPGRDNKVGREEMIGMMVAVETWKKRDHAAEWKTWLSYLNNISKKVTTIPGVTTSIFEPTELSNKSPVLHIMWDPAKLNITGQELAEITGRTKPRIAIGAQSKENMTSVQITTGQMQPGNDKVVADRIFEILSQKRNPVSTTMTAASAVLTGRWEATIEFFSSTAKHMLNIEQDGNWIVGSHKGEFTIRDLVGTIEADKIILRSVERGEADNVPFIFSGTVKGDSFSGDIYMGEYRTAKFSAAKYKYKSKRERIIVPSGPPLAT